MPTDTPHNTKQPSRSKYWNAMVDIIDRNFPKGKCKERGKALVLLAEIEMLLRGKPIVYPKANPEQLSNDWKKRFKIFGRHELAEKICEELEGMKLTLVEDSHLWERQEPAVLHRSVDKEAVYKNRFLSEAIEVVKKLGEI